VPDHDQRLKTAIRECLPELIELVRPEWSGRIDASSPRWEPEELFPDPPEGERRRIDLVARVAIEGEEALAHVEIEAADALTSLRGRLPRYHDFLGYRHGLPVASPALYLSVGLEGRGWDGVTEELLGDTLGTTRWPYLGLPALDGTVYVEGANLLGVALVGFMRIPEDRKPAVKARAMLRLAEGDLSAYKRFLLMELVEAYLPLDAPLRQLYKDLLETKEYQPVIKVGETTFERGEKHGQLIGQRAMLRRQLEKKFGPLSGQAAARLEGWSADRLLQLGDELLTAGSLAELGLADAP